MNGLPQLLVGSGFGMALVTIVNAIVHRRKLGADTARVFADAAALLVHETHEDSRQLREDNRLLRIDNRDLSEQVGELQRLVNEQVDEIADLKARLINVQTDVTATRNAVERREKGSDQS